MNQFKGKRQLYSIMSYAYTGQQPYQEAYGARILKPKLRHFAGTKQGLAFICVTIVFSMRTFLIHVPVGFDDTVEVLAVDDVMMTIEVLIIRGRWICKRRNKEKLKSSETETVNHPISSSNSIYYNDNNS
ncbi:hypothetical protein BDA99DRAFT_575917 [Phascolomyces articulosus]|uniref:Uncharacterized protein n=1 Tax=Phascolomyces articulosus TaxID=60185 RepID=A0AAD5JZZ3_9FUNG|nr:hypothetical protein BDA99DRAFT_575917 [Phascolomyces articulosus]